MSSVPRLFSKSTEGEGVSLDEAVVCRGVDRPVEKEECETMSIVSGEDAKRTARISRLGSGRFFGCKDLNRTLEARDMDRVRALHRSPYLLVSAEARTVAVVVSNTELVSDKQEV